MPSAEFISHGYQLQELGLHDLGPAVLDAWADLEGQALEPNAYLSPHFVLPALRHLDPGLEPLFIAVYSVNEARHKLVGFGVFIERGPSRQLPLRRLSAYASPHSYVTGLLVDRHRVAPVLSQFLAFFTRKGAPWQCVEFSVSRRNAPQMLALEKQAAAAGLVLDVRNEFQRAMFGPTNPGSTYPVAKHSHRRLKELNRQHRRLNDQGVVSGRLLIGSDADTPAAADRFAILENMGWKGEHATSLLSDPAGQAFFREMTDGFGRDGRIFFTELVLDGIPIASTCNLISGSNGFAFKIGWNPAYARFSPGRLLELWFVEHAARLPLDLIGIDSGAEQGSFIDSFWARRQTMATVLLPTTRTAHVLFALRREVQSYRQTSH